MSDDKKQTQTPPNPTWQRVQLARHPERPHFSDYLKYLCSEFFELHGDRSYGDDAAIMGGLARFNDRTIVILGQQKGRDTKENIKRNFSMTKPEGYRKARRLMEHAEKFGLPLFIFIDTPGADVGPGSDEHGQSQAIAENLLVLSQLRTPIISLVIGEGGSGGALALSIADRLLIMENAYYSVASPEAAAAILWRDAAQAPLAAAAMRITAQDMFEFKIADGIIPEPEGGAHTNIPLSMDMTRKILQESLEEIEKICHDGTTSGFDRLLEARYQKFRHIGRWKESATKAL